MYNNLLDTTVEINLIELENFIENKLPTILVENATDFATAAFILQTMFDKIDELKNREE